MSDREKIIQLLNGIPEYKIGYVLAYTQGIAADEDADNAFCEKLYQNYLDDPDPDKDDVVSFADCKKEWKIS